MAQLRQHYQSLEAQGWAVLGVTAQRADAVDEYRRAQNLPFPILIDGDRTVAKSYSVYTPFSMDSLVPTVNAPHNSTFLIGSTGLVGFVHVGVRSNDVPSEDALLDALATIG